MARFGLIAGKKGEKLQQSVNNANAIHIDTRWETTTEFLQDLTSLPPSVIDDMEAILLVDTGLPNMANINDATMSFLSMQDVMEAVGLKKVKLYFLTKNSELYNILKGNVKGMEGISYRNAEMFLLEDRLAIPYLVSIFQGVFDKTGIYSSKRETLSRIERLQKEKQVLVEEASQVSKESLEYGKKEPISEINQEEIVGSKKHQEMLKKQEYDSRKLEREIEQLKKKNEKEKNKGLTKKEREHLSQLEMKKELLEKEKLRIQGKEVELVIDSNFGNIEENVEEHSQKDIEPTITPSKPEIKNPLSEEGTEFKSNKLLKKDVAITSVSKHSVPKAEELSELYSRLNSADTDTLEKKLHSDKGVISFIGTRGSGVSGIVAQTAETYAMLGKKVLIIDLDLIMRSQTVYFPTYSDAVSEHKGVSNSLIRLTQVQSIKKTAVPVTSKIDLLSNEKTNETPKDGFHATISNVFENIIDDATDNYDIVLIDLPLDYLSYYIRHVHKIDKNVFVVKNKFYYIEDFFSIQLADLITSGDVFSNELLSKSNIILNLFRRDYRDLEGYQLNRMKVKKMLLNAGTPYDRIPVIGEVPEYKDWEEQYATKVRYIWTDDVALGMFRGIVSKIL